MDLKPFQEATVGKVLEGISAKGGSRRFLVADEVGLGKTRVAQHLITKLCADGQHLRVFYVCSSLSIIHQNRDAILEVLPARLRNHAKVSVDRLTLLPTAGQGTSDPAKVPFTLYTLTPGTLPGKRRTGRADERAVIWRLLCEAIPMLRRRTTIERAFSRGVSSWDGHLQDLSDNLDPDLSRAFRIKLAERLSLSSAAWGSTLILKLAEEIKAGRASELIAACRAALGAAALDRLSPDVIIFDEFQKFFELFVPGEDDDPVARELVDRLLAEDQKHKPAVVLLSATPYRLYTGWADGAHEHYEHFIRLTEFLLGRDRKKGVAALRTLLAQYRTALLSDEIGSKRVLGLRSDIEAFLGRVMTRTERPSPSSGPHQIEFDYVAAPLQPMDVGLFKHLSAAAAIAQDKSAVVGYWSSIPYPLQMMDQKYLFTQRAKPEPLRGSLKDAGIRWQKVRRFESIAHPHPKLRALLAEVPVELLAAPWMPPTRRWWPLGSIFGKLTSQTAPVTKVLVFSHYRAVPRAVSAVLSYEAERHCFSIPKQRSKRIKPTAYEYRTEKGASPLPGLRRRPRPSFVFPRTSKQDTSMRSLLMFLPVPALAQLGDPLSLLPSLKEPTLPAVLSAIHKRLETALGCERETKKLEAVWPWAMQLEKSSPDSTFADDLESWLQSRPGDQTVDSDDQHTGIDVAVQRFLGAPVPSRRPSPRELRELAELALLGPGNVLYRAVERVFGQRLGKGRRRRLAAVASASIHGLRPYLDLPDFHLLFRTREHQQHPSAIRQAIWDGNLEAVLDEQLAVAAGLGQPLLDIDREVKAIASLSQALSVGAASVSVQEVCGDSFRMRCHAALPFGLAGQEKESGEGEIRTDSLRAAFNSPFRPYVLTSTSIGQEGLDFHTWSNRIVHWDLPSNPVDFEQRDGRVDRYGGLAIRQAISSCCAVPIAPDFSPWRAIAEAQSESEGGLVPWWVANGAKIRRTILAPPFSRIPDDLQQLRDALALYRLTLGQADQEALVHALKRRVGTDNGDDAAIWTWFQKARISLAPNKGR